MIRAAIYSVALLLGVPAAAQAQTRGPAGVHAGSVEISGAAGWSGGYGAGSTRATETRNPMTGTGPLTLFEADARVPGTPAVQARVGVYLSRRVAIEGGLGFSRPVLSVRLTGDFEQAPEMTAEERLTQYLVDGSLVYHFGDGHVVPFILGGAGHLRQLHAGAAELQTGVELHAGGGLKYGFGRGASRAALRIDARVSSFDKTAGFVQKRHWVPIVSAGIAYRF